MGDADDIPQLVEHLPQDFTVQQLHLATVLDTTAYEPTNSEPRRIPVTIVTGYLGSGKLTLLDMVARTSNKRLAVILNEFGDTAAIEKLVTITGADRGAVQEWLDLGNGCLCCTVKDNGVAAIENLVQSSKDRIDHILLETTGVADPAPIAKMFWLDDALAASVYIDGVVTVVDLANIATCLADVGGHWHRANRHLAERLREGLTTAHLQIAMADCVLLNKADLVALRPGAMAELTRRLRAINALSPMYPTSFGDVSLDKILGLHAFEASAAPPRRMAAASDLVFHDDRIRTVALDFPFFTCPAGFARAELFLQKVLWDSSVCGRAVEVHRLKGILVHGADVRVVQGVRDTYDIIENGVLHPDITLNKLVFIGKDLDKTDLQTELEAFLRA
ncbi:cobW-domain-containing protein [Metschnikowia bicuspidata var. bicuspidata NRRL YB-4993]|uniref:CobW-domain-containing protein n=1 Tax=Metschnikowia bicuspidata var. bicuspidata NRRL YB-4993 TaxID=869754 RepID=A0A1A0HIS3_9ASCO|nr:cobW-domain-containing protein [Metschnikowia bicuspidata var. bicuspidata NRRL YB-4993]OBA23738.1 cobW-domain-containing protein [Metschnikowia bicuspidata var. bicuspidata NRRL YB-4993]